jgi:hypothetical protein
VAARVQPAEREEEMRKSNPRFEQVSLEVVEKIVEQQIKQTEVAKAKTLQGSPKDTQIEAPLRKSSKLR